MDKVKYKIELTEKQLLVYREALEFYSRFLAGQLDYLPGILYDNKNFHEIKKAMEIFVKPLMFPELKGNQSYGIGNIENELSGHRQIAYEMYREVFVLMVKENPDGGFSVYNSPTLKYSGEPLPTVKLITNE